MSPKSFCFYCSINDFDFSAFFTVLLEKENSLDRLLLQQSVLHDRLNSAVAEIDSVTQGSQQNPDLPTIYAITPTYKRFTQKADLTRLSQTFMHIPNFHWVVVEDAEKTSKIVKDVLTVKKIRFTHLAVKTQVKLLKKESDPHWKKHRGVDQRNLGLRWIRENVKDKSGVVYFADDDNTYDIDLFEEVCLDSSA